MNLDSQLEQVFATNFQVYYRTHVAHGNTVAEEEDHPEIANYAQDQIRILRKSCWMLSSILDDADDLDEEDLFED
jgi:DNA-binding ferritin-like protein